MKIEAKTEHTATALVRRDGIVVLSASASGEYNIHARSDESQEAAIRKIREFGLAIVRATDPTSNLPSMEDYPDAVPGGSVAHPAFSPHGSGDPDMGGASPAGNDGDVRAEDQEGPPR
jgi:hypothetical protein